MLTEDQKISRQLVRAMKADPVFLDLICQQIKRQQAEIPKGPDDLRRLVLAKQKARLEK